MSCHITFSPPPHPNLAGCSQRILVCIILAYVVGTSASFIMQYPSPLGKGEEIVFKNEGHEQYNNFHVE